MLVKGVTLGMSGFQGWFVGIVLNHTLRFLVKKGIYVINVGDTYVQTTMEKSDWEKMVGSSWQEVDKGNLTSEKGKALDDNYIKTFNKVAVFQRITNSK